MDFSKKILISRHLDSTESVLWPLQVVILICVTPRRFLTPIMGGLQPKKNRKKPVPNLKFAVAFGFFRFFFGIFRLFSVFFGFFRFFSVFCGTFSVFFGLNFDKKFQSFKNHVNNEVLGGQE